MNLSLQQAQILRDFSYYLYTPFTMHLRK